MTSILQDLLSKSLVNGPANHITVQEVTDSMIHRAYAEHHASLLTTSGAAKNLLEVQDLIRQAIEDYEMREKTTAQSKVNYTAEEPEIDSRTETVTYSLVKREPGGFGQGGPFESQVRNLRPVLREVKDDPTNPGYRLITLGYWHENIIRLTCWAKTNKAANARALWLENLMEDYTWWFVLSGVNRILYNGQGADLVVNTNNNRFYGRPLEYYVKTETIRVYSEKTLEEILIKLKVSQQ